LTPLGVHLSAFNLTIETDSGQVIPLESAFQGSKVFERGGPFENLYARTPKDARRDERLTTSGSVVGFRFDGVNWPTTPPTSFYDWIYIQALRPGLPDADPEGAILGFAGFTDIEFNPKKSLNCQARSCALFVALKKRGLLETALSSQAAFLANAYNVDHYHDPEQQTFDLGS